MTEYVLIYITAPDIDCARRIGRALVEERLAACANLVPGMQSIYWWNGAIEEANEVVVIAKTRAELTDALTKRVESLHPYACPCIVAIPIVAGSSPFLKWIGDETTGDGGEHSER